ncbi:TlyA family RNA methyltransferase [Oligoflexia bacterium]|nr:TlyA family RNA methyltransferase [Oligoflexia bacterium]
MKKKERLDSLLVTRGLAPSVSLAQALIMAGKVSVAGQCIDKAGTSILCDADIVVKEDSPFVSRGGLKLQGALGKFGTKVQGKICADVGACTGGFTDALLQNGAAKVFAIDVAHGDFAWKLRADEKVILMERTNAAHLESLDEPVDLVVVDVSLLSVKKILPQAMLWVKSQFEMIVLIKPQYEASPEQLPSGAVISDPLLHKTILLDVLSWMESTGLFPCALMASPILGMGGNKEFLVLLRGEVEGEFDREATLDHVVSPADA